MTSTTGSMDLITDEISTAGPLTVGTITQLVQPAGRVSWFPPMERNEFTFVVQPDPRDARIAELEAQVSKYRLFPQQVMDAIEQYDWDGERWFVADIRAIIEGKAGYPSRDDSLWFSGGEWQELLDRAITGSCATRDERIAQLETALREIRNYCGNPRIHGVDRAQQAFAIAAIALMPPPESDMSITTEELSA